jgi:hypothetical protein
VNTDAFLSLYERYRSEIFGIASRCLGQMTGPFLIAPSEKYWNSEPIRLAVVGREAREWKTDASVRVQMNRYSEFNVGESRGSGKEYSSPFWQVIRKFEMALTGEPYNCAWLNLNRWDENGHVPSPANQQILSELDFLLLEELRLLRPDLVMFFTGPSPAYDQRITSLVQAQAVPFSSFPEHELCELKSPLLNCRIFRTFNVDHLEGSRRADEVVKAVSLAMRIYSNSGMVINGTTLEIRQIRPIAARDSHKTLPPPAGRGDLGLSHSYTSSEFELIKQGFVPLDMDERWFIYYEEPWLYFHRSWTGACTYGVRFETSANGASIVESWVSRDSEQYKETSIERDRGICTFLIGTLLLGASALPSPRFEMLSS